MLKPTTLIGLLVLFVAAPAFAEKTLWLVRPLYPGQEALVSRTEQALDRLTPADQRPNNVIGAREFAAALKGKKIDELPCFNDTRCADPIDPFVAGFGFDRVVLVQGGQDEAGFKFKVASYQPALGKTNPASASDTVLENALLGAVAKVVPVASSLEVTTTPAGAVVYVDDKKVGTTPLPSTQVLPGEHTIRIDLKLHQPIEEQVVVQMRGTVKLDKTLEKVAARIMITATPAGTSISVDGTVLGKDRIDRGIQPGAHTIRLSAENHKAFETTVQVKADEQFTLDKTLEPLAGAAPVAAITIIKTAEPPRPAPPPPLSLVDEIYERKTYFTVGFDYDNLNGPGLVSHRFGTGGQARTLNIDGSSPSPHHLLGGTAEFGFFGRYFGMAAIGISVGSTDGALPMNIGIKQDASRTDNVCPTGEDDDASVCRPQQVNVRMVLGSLRAIQPQFRVQLWRFMLGLQAGFELRIGHIIEPENVKYTDGFMVLDLMLSARANVRFYVYEGLFLYGQYRFTALLTSVLDPTAVDPNTGAAVSSSRFSQGFNGGLGYAF